MRCVSAYVYLGIHMNIIKKYAPDGVELTDGGEAGTEADDEAEGGAGHEHLFRMYVCVYTCI